MSTPSTVETVRSPLVSHSSVVPVMLKPDALDGEWTSVPGPLAADFAGYLSGAVESRSLGNDQALAASSPTGAARALADVEYERRLYAWYALLLQAITDCRERLATLQQRWASLPSVVVPEIVADAIVVLGFDIVGVADHVLSIDDDLLFCRHASQPSLHEKMQPYLIGRRVRLLLACGQQENSALQMMKTYLRTVVRYPLEEVTYQNWLHITDPDSAHYAALLRMYLTHVRPPSTLSAVSMLQPPVAACRT